MPKFALAVHGGAGPDSEFIKKNIEGYKQGIKEALNAGYSVLEAGGSAVDAVEAAVNTMESNPLFNCGRGSAINAKGEVEMCASIMEGSEGKSGAVAAIRNVKYPVSLARAVMEKTKHIYLAAYGALDFANKAGLQLEPDAYFITDHQVEQYLEARKEAHENPKDQALEQINGRMHGTVGAVALDQDGNLAAATSTGGTEYAKEGRVADSSMIGVGTYAENKTCAVSTTGDGEYHIKKVSAHEIASMVRYKGVSVQEAAFGFIKEENGDTEGDMGLIAIDTQGNIALEFNCDRMHRGCKTSDGDEGIWIYPE